MNGLSKAETHNRKRYRFNNSDKIWLTIAMYGGWAILILFPLVIIFLWTIGQNFWAPRLLPATYDFHNWVDLISDDTIIQSLVNSVFISVIVTALTAGLALPSAFALARFDFKTKRLVEIFILSPMIIPGIVVAVSLGEIFLRMGLSYTYTGVILAQTVGTLPLMVRILTAGIEAIPTELLHASRTFGASSWQMVRTVVIPLSLPAFLAASLLTIVNSFEEFDKTFIVGAPKVATLPVKLFIYLDGEGLSLPIACSVAFLLLAPVLVIFIVAGRIMREDVMASGMGKL